MADFNFYLNRTGVRGPKGEQGDEGFSPIITVETNTLSEYILRIQTQSNNFLTANLREHKEDLGGTYIRYNRSTGVMYAGTADLASSVGYGEVRFATDEEIASEDESTVVSPGNVADMINATGVIGDVSELQGQVSTNTNNISTLQGQMTGLLADYVPKSRTINGKALSSNITLTASDVGALPSTTPIPTKTSDLTNDSDFITSADLPDMNNYYNTTQIDLMLNEKADVSDIPVVPTNVSSFTNDAGYITSADLPTVGNGTITFTQGGVTKGSITTNQSGDSTIALDAGGSQYVLPPATTSTLGGVIVDGTTITVDSNGVITSVGGGTTYNPGNGIDINSSNNTISAKPDGTTIDFNTDGELKVISAPTPNNMVTTDTTQTISELKTFSSGLMTPEIRAVSSDLSIRRTDGQYVNFYTNVDSGNIGTYAATQSDLNAKQDIFNEQQPLEIFANTVSNISTVGKISYDSTTGLITNSFDTMGEVAYIEFLIPQDVNIDVLNDYWRLGCPTNITADAYLLGASQPNKPIMEIFDENGDVISRVRYESAHIKEGSTNNNGTWAPWQGSSPILMQHAANASTTTDGVNTSSNFSNGYTLSNTRLAKFRLYYTCKHQSGVGWGSYIYTSRSGNNYVLSNVKLFTSASDTEGITLAGTTTIKYLRLNIDAGLAVSNGNLVNTNPTAPTTMIGADGTSAGTSGLVPAPSATDDTSILMGNGAWETTVDAGPIIAHNAMPSATYENLTIGASGSSYSAPSDGYVIFKMQANSTSGYIRLGCNTSSIMVYSLARDANNLLSVWIPVAKGDSFGISYSGVDTSAVANDFRFVYSIGTESEAS